MCFGLYLKNISLIEICVVFAIGFLAIIYISIKEQREMKVFISKDSKSDLIISRWDNGNILRTLMPYKVFLKIINNLNIPRDQLLVDFPWIPKPPALNILRTQRVIHFLLSRCTLPAFQLVLVHLPMDALNSFVYFIDTRFII